MKTLVFGGTRFIGRRLLGELLSAGHQVAIYTRGHVSHPFGGAVEALVGDRRAPADLARALAGREFDAVYDFLCYDAGDARLALDALAGRVGRYIHISTCSVYWCTGDFPCPVPEEDFDRLGDFSERPESIEYAYGYGKRQAERIFFEAWRRHGFPITTIRMPIVGGEGDLSLRLASYCLRVGDGQPLAMPDSGLAPVRQVYVGDAARLLARLPAIPEAAGQAYNLAGSEILSVRAIVAAVARVMGRAVQMVDIPSDVLRLLGTDTAFSPYSQPAAQVPAIHKARRELGWSPTAYPVWLERAVSWSLDAAGRGGAVPEAYTHRARELSAIQRYRAAALSLSSADGTSSARPG